MHSGPGAFHRVRDRPEYVRGLPPDAWTLHCPKCLDSSRQRRDPRPTLSDHQVYHLPHQTNAESQVYDPIAPFPSLLLPCPFLLPPFLPLHIPTQPLVRFAPLSIAGLGSQHSRRRIEVTDRSASTLVSQSLIGIEQRSNTAKLKSTYQAIVGKMHMQCSQLARPPPPTPPS